MRWRSCRFSVILFKLQRKLDNVWHFFFLIVGNLHVPNRKIDQLQPQNGFFYGVSNRAINCLKGGSLRRNVSDSATISITECIILKENVLLMIVIIVKIDKHECTFCNCSNMKMKIFTRLTDE